jgi:hypothetical protein
MQLVCRSAIALALLSTPMFACGGDDGGGNNTPMPDAKVFMDAAIDSPPACALPASFPGGTLGSDAMRQSLNWISKNAQTMAITFRILIPLDMTNKNFVQFVVPKQGASWTVNTPLNFEADPTKLATAAAFALVAENLNTQTGTADKLYLASSGSITFTEIAQTAGAKITFSTTAANFRQVDAMTGAVVAGGCTTMVGMHQVYVQQMTAVTFVPPGEPSPDGWRSELLPMPAVLAERQ